MISGPDLHSFAYLYRIANILLDTGKCPLAIVVEMESCTLAE